MALLCAISGNVPEQPVVSKKSGHVFEASLIAKYVQETGKCPITGAELSADEDLLPLATNKTVKPRASAATSIPGLLGLFHDEWDALMLEHHTLRQQLHTARQELAHALYQHDAASRVIARLMRERDEARAALETLRADITAELEAGGGGKRGAADDAGAAGSGKRSKGAAATTLPAEVVEVLDATNAQLSAGRKKRAVPEGTATPEAVAAFSQQGAFPLHKTTQGGILALAVSPDAPSLVATGGADSTVQLFDVAQQRVAASLKGHSKRVTGLGWGLGGGALVSASVDKTVRFWSGGDDGAGSWACAAIGSEHTAPVTGLAVHPSRRYAVSCSEDGSWAWWDAASGGLLLKQDAGAGPLSAVGFHPDGLLLIAGGSDGKAGVWEMRSAKRVASFDATGAGSPLLALSFSENGYHAATVAAGGVAVWDLRKMKRARELQPFEGGGEARAAAYDHTGQFLAVAGPTVAVYHAKGDWPVLRSLGDLPKKGAFSVAWGAGANSLLVGGGDHNLRLFGAGDAAMQD